MITQTDRVKSDGLPIIASRVISTLLTITLVANAIGFWLYQKSNQNPMALAIWLKHQTNKMA